MLTSQSGEKNREEASETVLGPSDGKISNLEIVSIANELKELDGTDDSYLLYLSVTMKESVHVLTCLKPWPTSSSTRRD